MDKNTVNVKFYDEVQDYLLKFAVIISRYNGKWVFCKHRERDTFEIPGGHREKNETIEQTARRELWEETGAMEYTLFPVCVYGVSGNTKYNKLGEESFGMLYYAEVITLEKELHNEIEKIELFEELPTAWTYPLIQPLLIEEFLRRKKI